MALLKGLAPGGLVDNGFDARVVGGELRLGVLGPARDQRETHGLECGAVLAVAQNDRRWAVRNDEKVVILLEVVSSDFGHELGKRTLLDHVGGAHGYLLAGIGENVTKWFRVAADRNAVSGTDLAVTQFGWKIDHWCPHCHQHKKGENAYAFLAWLIRL